jgi:hypothetical protein
VHVCPHDRAHLFKALADVGIQRGAVCLPDAGSGSVRWKLIGLRWGDEDRNLFGVTNAETIGNLVMANTDPLLHDDVVPYKQQTK